MDETKTQVNQALGRLEAAVEAIGERAAAREGQLAAQLEAARQDAAAAQAEAAEAKAATEGLKAANEELTALLGETSIRLDLAIERLQGLLAKAAEE